MTENSPHIIFTVTNDLTYDRRMDRICSTLVANGFKVSLVGRKLKNSTTLRSTSYSGVRLKCWFNHGFLFYAEYNLRLFSWLLFKSYDVVCACDLDTALPVRWISKLRKKKSVLDAHEYFSEVPEITSRPRVKAVWEWIGKITIPGFQLRYTVGEKLAELMSERYAVPFHIIRNIAPIESLRFQPVDILQREKIIFYQGALNIGRGLELLLEAMKQLPDWKLWLAGEGDIFNQLKDYAIQNKLEDRLLFLGWVQPEDLAGLMAKAKIGINLRDKGSLNDYYSLPNKFFDALNAGLPSINMKYPEYERINNRYHCALLLDELAVDKIVESVHQIDLNPNLLVDLARGCILAAKDLTWEKEAEKLIHLYKSLIAN